MNNEAEPIAREVVDRIVVELERLMDGARDKWSLPKSDNPARFTAWHSRRTRQPAGALRPSVPREAMVKSDLATAKPERYFSRFAHRSGVSHVSVSIPGYVRMGT
jgi:hypothetical protein